MTKEILLVTIPTTFTRMPALSALSLLRLRSCSSRSLASRVLDTTKRRELSYLYFSVLRFIMPVCFGVLILVTWLGLNFLLNPPFSFTSNTL